MEKRVMKKIAIIACLIGLGIIWYGQYYLDEKIRTSYHEAIRKDDIRTSVIKEVY